MSVFADVIFPERTEEAIEQALETAKAGGTGPLPFILIGLAVLAAAAAAIVLIAKKNKIK
ncbi:MAG: LPXTG cell wall anchor domain-containing protein [Clostridia bacterium]|nr:LPXTG cell wall anchor domain-containing protein [Clostridia bacterium]